MAEVNEDVKKSFLKHLADLHTAFRIQHNHKEISAWAGIVFFSVICLQLAKFDKCNDYCFLLRLGSTIFLGIFSSIVWKFIKKQYELQRQALNTNVACMSLIAKIISGKEIKVDDCKPAPDDNILKETKGWHIFPKCLLEEMKEMRDIHLADRLFLERLGYCVFFAIVFLTLYSIWIDVLIKLLDCITGSWS
jgi:hypothetical protein